MMESLNIDNMVKFNLDRKRYRAGRLWIKAKISSIVTFEFEEKKDRMS